MAHPVIVRGDPLVPAQLYIHVGRRVRVPVGADINVSIRNAFQEEPSSF